jgi:hypothetical protein
MNKYLSTTLALSTLALAISAPANAAGLTTLSEGFNNVSGLAPNWAFVNNSNPAPISGQGTATWTQGNTSTSNYAAQSGSANSFAQVDFNSTTGDVTGANGTISNWLITPELDFTNGSVFSFYARTLAGNSFAELVEVRQSNAGSSTNVGTAATSLGDFTTLLGSVGSLNDNPPYPSSWTKFTFNIAPTSGSGRVAFRYFATNGGVNGVTGQYATIDTFNYGFIDGPPVVTPEPSSMAGMLLIGGLGAATRLRNKAKKVQA